MLHIIRDIIKVDAKKHYSVIILHDTELKKASIIRNYGLNTNVGKVHVENFHDNAPLAAHLAHSYYNEAIGRYRDKGADVTTELPQRIEIDTRVVDHLKHAIESGESEISRRGFIMHLQDKLQQETDLFRVVLTSRIIMDALSDWYEKDTPSENPCAEIPLKSPSKGAVAAQKAFDDMYEASKKSTEQINTHWGAFS